MEIDGCAVDWLLQSFELKRRSRAAILRRAVAEAEVVLSNDGLLLGHDPASLGAVAPPLETPSSPVQSPLQLPRQPSRTTENGSCSLAAAVPQPSSTNNSTTSSNETYSSNNLLPSGTSSFKDRGPAISRVVSSQGSNSSSRRRSADCCSSRVGDVQGSLDLQPRTITTSNEGRVHDTNRHGSSSDPDVDIGAGRGEEAVEFVPGLHSSPNEWQDLAWRKRRRRATHLSCAWGLHAVDAPQEEEKGEDQPVPLKQPAVAASGATPRVDSEICGALGCLDLSHISAHSSGSWDRPLPLGSWELTTGEDMRGAQFEDTRSEESAAALAARIKINLRGFADINVQSQPPGCCRHTDGQWCSQGSQGEQLNGFSIAPNRQDGSKAGAGIREGRCGGRQQAAGYASRPIAGEARNNRSGCRDVEVKLERGSESCRDSMSCCVVDGAKTSVIAPPATSPREGASLDDGMATPSPLPPLPTPLRPTLRGETTTTAAPLRQTIHALDSFAHSEGDTHGEGGDGNRGHPFTGREQRHPLHQCRRDPVEVTAGDGEDDSPVNRDYCDAYVVNPVDLGDDRDLRQDGDVALRDVVEDSLPRQCRDVSGHGWHTDAVATRRWTFPLNGTAMTATELQPAPADGVVAQERSRQASVPRRFGQGSSAQYVRTDECSVIGDVSAALVRTYDATQQRRSSSLSGTCRQVARCESLPEGQNISLGDANNADTEAIETSCARREVLPAHEKLDATRRKAQAGTARIAVAKNTCESHSTARGLKGSDVATEQSDCMAGRDEQGVHNDVADEKDAPTAATETESSQSRGKVITDSQRGAQAEGGPTHQGTLGAGSISIDELAAERQPTTTVGSVQSILVHDTSKTDSGDTACVAVEEAQEGEDNRWESGPRAGEDYPSTTNRCGQQRTSSVVSVSCPREIAGVFFCRVDDSGQQQERTAAHNFLRHWLSRMIRRQRSGARRSRTHAAVATDSKEELRYIQEQGTTGISSALEATTTVSSKVSSQGEKEDTLLPTSGHGATENDSEEGIRVASSRLSIPYKNTVLRPSPREPRARPYRDIVKNDSPGGPRYATQRNRTASICRRYSEDDAIGRLSSHEMPITGAMVGAVSASPAASKPWMADDGGNSVESAVVVDRKYSVATARHPDGRLFSGKKPTVPVLLAPTKNPLHHRDSGRDALGVAGGASSTETPAAHQASPAPPRVAHNMKQKKQHAGVASDSISRPFLGASSARHPVPVLKEQQQQLKHGDGHDFAGYGKLNHDLGEPCAVNADWLHYCDVGAADNECLHEHNGGVVSRSRPSRQERAPATNALTALVGNRGVENRHSVMNTANTTTKEVGGVHTGKDPAWTRPSRLTTQRPQRTGSVAPPAHPSAPSEGAMIALLARGNGRARREGVDVRSFNNPLLEARCVGNPLLKEAAGFSGK